MSKTLLVAEKPSVAADVAREMNIRTASRSVFLDDVPTPATPESFAKKKPDPNVLLPWLQKHVDEHGAEAIVSNYDDVSARCDPTSTPDGRAPSGSSSRRRPASRYRC